MAQHTIKDPNGITNIQLRQFCPSVLAETAHESRSERYLPIPTFKVLDVLHEIGYVPTEAMQSIVRQVGRMPFAKHLLRLRQEKYLGMSLAEVPEIVLVNSFDGSSAYSVMAGLFRTVCSNGLITGDIASTLKVAHRGNVIDSLLTATTTIAEEAEGTMALVARMKHIQLAPRERLLLAQFAEKARYGDVVEGTLSNPQALLETRRREDEGNGLWQTFNTVQENTLVGGVAVRNGKRARSVKSIKATVDLNTLLWQFSQKLLEFKEEGN
jgi:hypothetical protein